SEKGQCLRLGWPCASPYVGASAPEYATTFQSDLETSVEIVSVTWACQDISANAGRRQTCDGVCLTRWTLLLVSAGGRPVPNSPSPSGTIRRLLSSAIA